MIACKMSSYNTQALNSLHGFSESLNWVPCEAMYHE